MTSLKYFHINNVKFSYDLEFNSKSKNDFWKYNVPLIEYCETLGITIPHYCYHKNLSISGNCRMCLIELKNSPKPVVSCAMSAKACLNNGEIFTNSPLVKKARENILEFLLLNHPLDCPICDQGGECDLQDQSLFFGFTKKRFYGFKRVVIDKNIGPIVKTVMTRCIHCTRCVRFATEVAGVEDLGIFGRGMQSEIGTYVDKTFQSELSGNIIDLCPVGALTSKPYPFIGRSWELKTVGSIDFSDGLGLDTQVFLKNNQVIKILPSYDSNENATPWISDKTRFSFDGMFSPERVLNGFVMKQNNQTSIALSWKQLFEEFVYILYFQDHLAKHFFKINSLIILFNSNVNIEVLNLLLLLSKKYSFIKLRKSEPAQLNNDLEANFLLSSSFNKSSLFSSNICFLIGVNPRYEGSTLNVKIRQRFLKGNFKVISLSSFVDLTYPIHYLGSNLEILKSVLEGSNLVCQELVNNKNPLIITSSELFKRKDSLEFAKLLQTIDTHLKVTVNKNRTNINILNTSVNDAGLSSLNIFKPISQNDLQNSMGVHLINSSFNVATIKKLVELRLLKIFNEENTLPKFFLDQNCGAVSDFFNHLKLDYNTYNYINLPNNVFFETNNTIQNTEGVFKKTVKLVSPLRQSKEDWNILRKILSYSKNISFIGNSKFNNRVVFNCKNISNFKNYIGFQHYAVKNLTEVAFSLNKKSCEFNFKPSKFKQKRNKIFKTKMRLWLDDFYIGGKDNFSKHSSTMITCSKTFRTRHTTFNLVT